MRRRVLYYVIFYEPPDYKTVAYAMVQYTDGSSRYWYDDDKGFKSAVYRARASKKKY